jgi:hypothetical protein
MIITSHLKTRTVGQMVYESDEVVAVMMDFACHTIVMPVDSQTVINIEKFITLPHDDGSPDDIYVVGTYQPQNMPMSMMVSPNDTVYIISLRVEKPTPPRSSSKTAHLN